MSAGSHLNGEDKYPHFGTSIWPEGLVLKRFCAFLLYICVLSTSQALAQSDGKVTVTLEILQDEGALEDFVADRSYFGMGLWKYRAGDDPTWADPDFDDASWEIVDTRLFASDLPEGGWNGIGWFRLHVDAVPDVRNTSLGLLYRQVGAAEIYLDGRKIHSLGTVAASQQEEETQLMLAPPPLVISFDDRESHVLAVRYSNFDVEEAHRHGFPAGFWMLPREGGESVEIYSSYLRKWSGVQMSSWVCRLLLPCCISCCSYSALVPEPICTMRRSPAALRRSHTLSFNCCLFRTRANTC